MVGSDEPQLQVQIVVPLLHTNKVENIVVLHAIHAVDLVLVLPGELVLEGAEHGKVSGEVEMNGGRQGGKKEECPGTWMGKIFTATYSLSSCAFHTQPKRPLAFTSMSCRGLCPRTGEGGDGPGS